MRNLYLAIAAIMLVSSLAEAQVSTTQPANDSAPVRRGPRLFRPGMGFGGFGSGPVADDAYESWVKENQSDIDAAMKFMKEHSPERFRFFNSIVPERRRRATEVVLSRYRDMRAKMNDPEMSEVILKRVGLEDEIFGIMMEIRRHQPDEPFTRIQQASLRERVGELVDLGMKERKLRIENLQRALELEKKQLEGQTINKEKLIQERIDRFSSEPGAGFFGGPGPAGRGRVDTVPTSPADQPTTTPVR